jgi:hypothetical protein
MAELATLAASEALARAGNTYSATRIFRGLQRFRTYVSAASFCARSRVSFASATNATFDDAVSNKYAYRRV